VLPAQLNLGRLTYRKLLQKKGWRHTGWRVRRFTRLCLLVAQGMRLQLLPLGLKEQGARRTERVGVKRGEKEKREEKKETKRKLSNTAVEGQ
jgi:hypothetical protein